MTPAEVARDMNTIARFTGIRDVPELSRAALRTAGLEDGVVDVAVLTGGAILAGGDVMAGAMRAGVARTYALVGGAGHTTSTFRARVRELWPAAHFADDASEAEVWDAYLRSRYGLAADVLETRSTNSGNNITFLFKLLRERGTEPASVLLVQDATMQRRLDACLRFHEPQVRAVNYAAYRTEVVAREGMDGRTGDAGGLGASGRNPTTADPLSSLTYDHEPFGMWDVDHYLTLLMGEVPRLTDGPGGYGPRGANLIAHVDVPDDVHAAFARLRDAFPDHVRTANPAFASPATGSKG
ncbi:ElyC/SanA/YdcF family protein [uncultured Parolsenella sp.]|uniref:ElyC/SanA/YdcF family protein n=1 Tax=uncultured Parolsenella sp. TaxID=2083008 RepID=UPI0027D94A08|nr:ElyC/SanA/YdcF family protein [uncultured Parolsenella sp.]